MKRILISLALSAATIAASAQQQAPQFEYRSQYPDIPIVDVHYHPDNWRSGSVPEFYAEAPRSGPDSLPVESFANVMKVRDILKEKYGSNLGYFVCLNNVSPEDRAAITAVTDGRTLFSIHAGITHSAFQGGLNYTPEEIIDMVENDGFQGLKFWFGTPSRQLTPGKAGITKIDDPRFAPLFSKLEAAGVMLTSLHIADPNGPFHDRKNYMADPVYFWEQIRAFENVVAAYPDLTVLAAHGAWLTAQDAQFDYLRYMLATYPNLYVDMSATQPYMNLSNRENVRDFYIEFADRILFGSDAGRIAERQIESNADRYARAFAYLETDMMMPGRTPVQGLDLPREVLEKIYYKNALKLYPGLKAAWQE
ncbi:MAG: amidohydrolase [Alistipes sp.]|jgi:predicted TIM-barrel fold metal-dependent hydrolase|nr:amidohydrolase [Alistipes sp.]